jgi:mannose/fructose/N-acetylgalactosamine-specific phosphotransferase system component IIC
LSLLVLVALGSFVALDATSFGQLMLSRPLVAGTLAGAVVGLPLEGAIIGALLEVLSFSILPVGAAKYPETGTAAVAAVGTLGLAGLAPTPPTLLLVLVYGLAWQRLFGATVIAGRYVNERLVHAGELALSGRMDRMIERRHVASMVLDLLRGASVTAVALIIGVPLLRLAAPAWSLPPAVAAVVVSVAAAAALAGAARLFGGTRRDMYLLLAGLVCGLTLLLLP